MRPNSSIVTSQPVGPSQSAGSSPMGSATEAQVSQFEQQMAGTGGGMQGMQGMQDKGGSSSGLSYVGGNSAMGDGMGMGSGQMEAFQGSKVGGTDESAAGKSGIITVKGDEDMQSVLDMVRQMMAEKSDQGMQSGGAGQGSPAIGAAGAGSGGSNCDKSSSGGGSSPQGGGSAGGSGMGAGPADGGKDNGPISTTPSDGSGEFKLGGTDIKIEGGTAEQRAKVEENFKAMYKNDPEFKAKIDAKADSGINVGFKEFEDNVAAKAEIDGNNMWMDSSYMNGGSQGIAEVIAHEVGHLDGLNHGTELDDYSKRAAQSIA